ncbi:hypothetical protein GCM10008101_20630 [Lysobacter xinjiangensis]|uniref:Uncharacterized protein n=1 Tax=Cognatilysobacter xinjiangensis TaxID=546892 RepID=A0ABQ3C456_9GAMM|nr:hypothetical protein [Lysobacter xinjiangensis]GGZ66338.1 hypothetical protein GCM10008101_20630 [Lysobacter xinjiangensis]
MTAVGGANHRKGTGAKDLAIGLHATLLAPRHAVHDDAAERLLRVRAVREYAGGAAKSAVILAFRAFSIERP